MRNPVFTNHPEAMCLMTYKCEKCGKREVLWNSRPRVTPFMISCSACDGVMQHIEWQNDKFAPNHRPSPGDRIFVDLSRETSEASSRRLIEKFWDSGDYPMKDRYDSKEEALECMMEDWDWGQPHVMVVPEDPNAKLFGPSKTDEEAEEKH